MASTTTGSGSSAHTKLLLVQNTSELHALTSAMNAHDNSLHAFMAELAAHLRKELPGEIKRRGGGLPGAFGIDAKLSARRVAHPLTQIAKLYQETSRLYVVAYTEYQNRVLNISNKPGSHGGFNADL